MSVVVNNMMVADGGKLESVAWGGITGTLSDQTNLQAALDLKLDAADYSDRFLGLYASVLELETAHPTANAGDYAQVDWGIGTDVIVYAYDVDDAQWAAVGSSAIANTDALPEGSSNLYHTGQRVRDTPLTGLSLASATAITAADSVLSAAGKLQGQASANATAIAGKLNTADAPATVRGTALTGLSLATATPVTADDTVLTAAGKLQAQIEKANGLYNPIIGLYKSGEWFNQAHAIPHISGNASINAGTAFYFAYPSHADWTAVVGAINVQTAGAGATAQFAVYASDAINDPASRSFLSPVFDCSTTGDKSTTVDLIMSDKKLYWIGVLILGNTVNLRALSSQYMRPIGGMSAVSGSPSTVYFGTSQTALAANGAEIMLLPKSSYFAPVVALQAA